MLREKASPARMCHFRTSETPPGDRVRQRVSDQSASLERTHSAPEPAGSSRHHVCRHVRKTHRQPRHQAIPFVGGHRASEWRAHRLRDALASHGAAQCRGQHRGHCTRNVSATRQRYSSHYLTCVRCVKQAPATAQQRAQPAHRPHHQRAMQV